MATLSKKESAHKYYILHKQKILKKKRIYNKIHREEISEQRKVYYQQNKERFKQLHEKYYLENKRKIQKYTCKYYNSHKQEVREYNQKYYMTNRDVINKKRNIYFKNRKKKDPKFKIMCNLRSRISEVLKADKSKSTMKLVGCSIEFLKRYLESKFKKRMTWKNYSKWHIDHIKPCVSFNLSKLSEQKKCFNYRNLQPLWAKENLEKNRY